MTRRAWWLVAALVVAAVLWSRGGEPLYRTSWTEAAFCIGGALFGYVQGAREARRCRRVLDSIRVRIWMHDGDERPSCLFDLGGREIAALGEVFGASPPGYPDYFRGTFSLQFGGDE